MSRIFGLVEGEVGNPKGPRAQLFFAWAQKLQCYWYLGPKTLLFGFLDPEESY